MLRQARREATSGRLCSNAALFLTEVLNYP
jgi:hypothetical protein